jgi:heptosyltransferase-2
MIPLEKILIIRFSSMGDVILSSPLIRVLRAAYPEAKIDFLVKSEFAELVRYNPHLSSVIELKTSDRAELKDLKQHIRSQRYDAIFDLHNSLRSRYLRIFSHAQYVRTINKRAIARFILVKFKKNVYSNRNISVAERYLETAQRFGIHDDGQGLEIFLSNDIIPSVSSMLSKYRKHKKILAFVPSAKYFSKRWLAGGFVKLGAALANEFQAKILIFGGKEEIEYCGDIAQMINAESESTAAESFAGKFSLLETAAAFDSCDVVVTNDTGLMHLAAARKRKIAAIFGSTVSEFGFFPYATENIVIEKKGLYCRPCSHIGLNHCPEEHFRCMKEVEAEEVVRAARTLMGG